MSEALVYQDSAGEWRWQIKADNGEIVAVGESYTTKADAERGLEDALAAAANLAAPPGYRDDEALARVDEELEGGEAA